MRTTYRVPVDGRPGLDRGPALLVAAAFFMEILDGAVIAPAAPHIAADRVAFVLLAVLLLGPAVVALRMSGRAGDAVTGPAPRPSPGADPASDDV